MGLFGGGRQAGARRRRSSAGRRADAKAIAEYLAAPAPDTVLALVGEELRKDSPLAKACGKAGEVLVYEVSKRELPKWVAEQFARHGVKVDRRGLPRAGRAGRRQPARARQRDRQALALGRRRRDRRGRGRAARRRAGGRHRRGHSPTLGGGARSQGCSAACESILERSTRSGAIPMLVGQPRCARPPRAVLLTASTKRGSARATRLGASSCTHSPPRRRSSRRATSPSTSCARQSSALADLDLAVKGGSRLPPELELAADAGRDHAARRLT